MKIFNEKGSKDRLLEMFQKVNKVKLNEDIMANEGNLMKNSLDALVNGDVTIKETSTEVNGNMNDVTITATDDGNNELMFKFRITGGEGDQEGIFNVSDAIILEFKFIGKGFEVEAGKGEMVIDRLSAERKEDIKNIVADYVKFGEEQPGMDEVYEEAIRKIDSVPYKGGSERMQKHKAYADQKPVNNNVRVSSDQLEKFIKEEFGDLPPEYINPEDIEQGFDVAKYTEKDDEGEPLVDPDTIQPSDEEEVPEDVKRIILQAYDNLVQKAERERRYNYSPTQLEVEDEILNITGQKVVKEKKRVFPKEAEPFLEGSVADYIIPDVIAKNSYNKLSFEKKSEYVFRAKNYIEQQIGSEAYFGLPEKERNSLIAQYANNLFISDMEQMNESEKKDYPTELGKEFKPDSDYPGAKKKYKSKKVKIKEEEEKEEDDGMSFEPKGDEVEQLAQEKEKVGDVLPGGLADDKSPQEFDPEQISMGIKVEMEHTDNPMTALEIAMDHLAEFPDYYTRLDAMEKEAEKEHGEGEEESETDDEEKTDVLLGYEPKNVGDEMDEEYDFAAAEREYEDKDAYDKYMKYAEKDFNSLRDTEKDEYFQLWNQFKGAEKMNEVDYEGGEKQLSDFVDEPGSTEIWYAKPDVFKYLIWGYDELMKNYPDKMPDPNNLEKTHSLIGTIAETDPERIFDKLNTWGGEEEYELLQRKGVHHTSMSIGDIIKMGNKILMVDGYGFKELNSTPDNTNTTGNIEFGNASISEAEIKKARQALNKRGLNEGMSKKEATQILIKHYIK